VLHSLEQDRRPALAHHVHRPTRLGTQVLIKGLGITPETSKDLRALTGSRSSGSTDLAVRAPSPPRLRGLPARASRLTGLGASGIRDGEPSHRPVGSGFPGEAVSFVRRS
jgi:hypothetical protein